MLVGMCRNPPGSLEAKHSASGAQCSTLGAQRHSRRALHHPRKFFYMIISFIYV
jgi:hypothetical protein